MNIVGLVGRLTRDPDIRQTESTTVARFTLAVDRQFKRDGEPAADFINVVCFGKTAEFVGKYFTKGLRVGINGRIQTGSYEKDGTKVYTVDVIANNVEFAQTKAEANNEGVVANNNSDFVNVPESMVEELPFD